MIAKASPAPANSNAPKTVPSAPPAVELFRSGRRTGEPLGHRAENLAQCNEGRKHEGVVEMPEVLESLQEERPANPQSGCQENGQDDDCENRRISR